LEGFDFQEETRKADQRIRAYIRETPVEFSPYLSAVGRNQVYLKLENFQLTGSFKIRGAMNKLLSLSRQQLQKGVVTASSGNHGAAVSYGLQKLNGQGTVFLPQNTSQTKIDSLRDTKVNIEFFGDDCVQTEAFARKKAERKGMTYIPPYNDKKIIAGQATVGFELERQVKNAETICVPVGGGGLISGIAGYLKTRNKNIDIIGCQPKNSAVMAESIKAGHILDTESKPTLSDGTAGGIEKGSLTFEVCKNLVDGFFLVSEREIKQAIRIILEKHSMLIEGAAALPVASLLKFPQRFVGKTTVLIISGARLSLEQLFAILCEGA
jgi:threonine dehydratase